MQCVNCQSEETTLIHNKVWSIDNGSVHRCKRCDLSFISPMMSDEEEKAFYQNFNEHVQNRGMTQEKDIQEYHNKSLHIAKERLKVVKSYFKPNDKVLEIGSSTGAFISLLEQAYTSVVEPSDENRAFSQQFITAQAYASIEEISTDEKFDVICMFHVFEHIKDPASFLKICHTLLKNNGTILIEVPHIEDPLISVYNIEAFKDFIFQPMHPMIYSKKSLDYIFHHNNFATLNTIYHQRYGLNNHLSWLKNNKPGGDATLNALFDDNIQYKYELEQSGKTDTLFYLAQKDI